MSKLEEQQFSLLAERQEEVSRGRNQDEKSEKQRKAFRIKQNRKKKIMTFPRGVWTMSGTLVIGARPSAPMHWKQDKNEWLLNIPGTLLARFVGFAI